MYIPGLEASGRYVIVQMDNGRHPLALREVTAFGRSKLDPEDRKELGNYLAKPNGCPGGQNNSRNKRHTGANFNKRPPIIDVFFNPGRSDELEKLLKISQDYDEATADKTKVAAFINLSVQKVILCRLSSPECIRICSASCGSRPCPASPRTPPQRFPIC